MSARIRAAIESVVREWRMHLGKLVGAAFAVGAGWSTAQVLLAWVPPLSAGAAGMAMYMIVAGQLIAVADDYLRVGDQ